MVQKISPSRYAGSSILGKINSEVANRVCLFAATYLLKHLKFEFACAEHAVFVDNQLRHSVDWMVPVNAMILYRCSWYIVQYGWGSMQPNAEFKPTFLLYRSNAKHALFSTWRNRAR